MAIHDCKWQYVVMHGYTLVYIVIRGYCIVLVRAYHQLNLGKKITTKVALEDLSTYTFIADALLEKLEVDATEVDLQVNTIVGASSIRNKKVVGLSIQDLESKYGPIKVPFAYSREYIPASHMPSRGYT